MVRLVDHDHIPARVQRLPAPHGIAREKRNSCQHQLRGEKRILPGVAALARDTTRLVINAEPEIKAPQQLDEPLVRERLGHQDQHALGPTDREQPLQNQARFDCLPETDLVGEQHPRHLARGDLLQNIKLMRQQLQPPTEVAAHLGLPEPRLRPQRPITQIKYLAGIDLSRQQALLRQTHTGHARDFLLLHALAAGPDIHQKPGFLLDRRDDQCRPRSRGNGFTGPKLHPLQHRGSERVEALFARSGELHADPSRRPVHARHYPEAELRLALAHAPLSDRVDFHTKGPKARAGG